MHSKDISEYSSVQRWMGSGTGDPIQARLRQQAVDVLTRFCAHQNTDPDTMIAAASKDRHVKNEFMRALKDWIKSYANNERKRHDAENVVRSFFIANGLRVITKPYLDVYNRNRPDSGGAP
jgi:hypothetical protein